MGNTATRLVPISGQGSAIDYGEYRYIACPDFGTKREEVMPITMRRDQGVSKSVPISGQERIEMKSKKRTQLSRGELLERYRKIELRREVIGIIHAVLEEVRT
jgi:hypothetical protein